MTDQSWLSLTPPISRSGGGLAGQVSPGLFPILSIESTESVYSIESISSTLSISSNLSDSSRRLTSRDPIAPPASGFRPAGRNPTATVLNHFPASSRCCHFNENSLQPPTVDLHLAARLHGPRKTWERRRPRRPPIQSVSRRGRRRSQGAMTDTSWFELVSPHQQVKRPVVVGWLNCARGSSLLCCWRPDRDGLATTGLRVPGMPWERRPPRWPPI